MNIKMIEEYLNKGIKDVIKQFPPVADILNEYKIGCTTCGVGTCLLKDIVQIHNLPAEDEEILMARITKIIYPDQEVKIPTVKKKKEQVRPEDSLSEGKKPSEIKYSPPMKRLVDEHTLIKRWLAFIPAMVNNLDIKSEKDRRLILAGVDFIRSYADKYHHAKEEEILFKYFDPNLDILKVIHQDHETGRGYVRLIVDALDKQDSKTIAENLNAYKELLTEHIKKEDEILYPWMDRNLSTTQTGELFSKFNNSDKQFGDAPKNYEAFIARLEKGA
ncbi:MAG: hemerythrin domain-containing protein [Planctomycetota bacterium]